MTPGRKERKNSHATPSPCTDGRAVYAVFGDGSVAALDFAGKLLWTNRDVPFYSRHGLGASPILHDGLLIMPYDGSNKNFAARQGKAGDDERLGWQLPWDQSFIAALDVKTGQRVWTGKRGLSRIAHVTPITARVNGRTQILSPAGDRVQGFDPKTGALIWSAYSQGEGVTPSPVLGDGVVFTSSGFEKTTIRAIRLGGRGEVTDSHILWEQIKGAPTQPSFLFVKPHLYALTDGGILTCYDGRTGELVYQERVGGNHSASPVYADGHIYCLSEQGEGTVVKAGPKFEIIARNPIEERFQASIAISQGNLFLRSEKALYRVGR
jgi:outer membrane protein assembly factor BamB